jgi:hypothetical protein
MAEGVSRPEIKNKHASGGLDIPRQEHAELLDHRNIEEIK